MAADDNILKSYLYLIGAKLDEPSIRKAGDALDKLSKTILGIGGAIEGMALALGAATIKMADGFEQLYYSSKRTGSSAKEIKGFEYAISQLGGTVEGAHEALENYAAFMRRTPGGANYIKAAFGVTTTGDAKRDLEGIAVALGRMYRAGGPERAKGLAQAAYAGLGNEDTIRALIDPSFHKFDEDVESSSVNMDKAAKNSQKFMQQVRYLGLQLDILKTQVFSDLEDKFGGKLVQFTDYLRDNMPEIAKGIERIIDKIIILSDKIEEIVKKIGGWQTVGEAVLAYFAGKWALGMIAAFRLVTLSPAFLALTGAIAAAAGLTYAVLDKNDPVADPAGGAGATGASGSARSPKAKQALDFFVKAGYTTSQAAGIVANLIAESGLDPHVKENSYNKGHQGIAQWDERRQADFKSFFGHDIRQSTYEEQLQFIVRELSTGEKFANYMLKLTNNPRSGAQEFGRSFERFGDLAHNAAKYKMREDLAEAIFSGSALGVDNSQSHSTTIHNDIDVNVTGSGDNTATGAAVVGAIKPYASGLRDTRAKIN